MNHTSKKSTTLSKTQTMNIYLLTQTLSVFLMQTLMIEEKIGSLWILKQTPKF